VAVLTAGIAVIAQAGCGGSASPSTDGPSSGGPYDKTMTKLGNDFAGTLSTLQGHLGSATTPTSQVALLDQIRALAERTASGVSALTPPSDVAAMQSKLVAELHQFAAVLVDYEAAVKSNDATRVSHDQDQYSKVGNSIPNTFLDISIKTSP
jgi:hypothetical protein